MSTSTSTVNPAPVVDGAPVPVPPTGKHKQRASKRATDPLAAGVLPTTLALFDHLGRGATIALVRALSNAGAASIVDALPQIAALITIADSRPGTSAYRECVSVGAGDAKRDMPARLYIDGLLRGGRGTATGARKAAVEQARAFYDSARAVS